MNQLPDFTGAFIMAGAICAIAGWALIQGAIWIGSHISLGWI